MPQSILRKPIQGRKSIYDVEPCIDVLPHVQPQQQASAIEKSVTHLLVATKQLLETLTQWSRGNASETDVSDVYVRLGYEFNIASRAFTQVNIDTNDLGPVPDTLRAILEETLSQEASQQSLDKFLPRIRDIIINLLHGLKRKQTKLRQQTGRDKDATSSTRRTGSLASTSSPHPDETESTRDSRAPPQREGSRDVRDGRNANYAASTPDNTSPQRHDSGGAGGPRRAGSSGKSKSTYPQTSEARTEQPPAIPPYPQEQSIPGPSPAPTIQEPPPPPSSRETKPRPPPKQDALAALQRSGELERRASRRYSTYQIRKELGTSTGSGVPLIPPTQRTPVPNRGREIRESMQAIRTRGSQYLQRPKSRPSSPEQKPEQRAEPKPEPVTSVRQGLRDVTLETNQPNFAPPTENPPSYDSPNTKTPDDKYVKLPSYNNPSPSEGTVQATISRPWEANYPIPEVSEPSYSKQIPVPPTEKQGVEPEKLPPPEVKKPDPTVRQSILIEPLTLFLQHNAKVKKLVLSGGYEELTKEKLQYEFIEKFSWNVHNNDVELPEIYIQDPASGIRYELEDLHDVKPNALLVLNTDHVTEVKKHVDNSMADIRGLLDNVTKAIGDQSTSIQQISKKQQDSSEELARFATQAASQPSATPQQSLPNGIPKAPPRAPHVSTAADATLQELRRELAVLRQDHTKTLTRHTTDMTRLKDAALKEAASHQSFARSEGDNDRAYVDEGKKRVNEGCEALINKVDNVQNGVEVLRKDVTRGSRPRPEDLSHRRAEIDKYSNDLRQLRELAQRETPIWKKIGEKQLKAVMDDQEEIKLNEELFADLEEDIKKTTETLDLVAEAAQQQSTTRSSSRTLKHANANGLGSDDPEMAKANLLGEVRALRPNHDSRVAAIEEAEQARKQQLAHGMDSAFKMELGQFVDEGKLKKTGGVEEVERVRVQREADARRQNHENQLEMARRRAEQAEASSSEEEEDDDDGDAGAVRLESEPPRLEVPGLEDDGQVSPEPEFVEASEVVPNGSR
ncbi:MAG: hypothetical protein Q9162_001070 [Coniocarpon cinnabarinum]